MIFVSHNGNVTPQNNFPNFGTPNTLRD